MNKYYVDPNWCRENPVDAAAELERLHKWCDELEAERDALAAQMEKPRIKIISDLMKAGISPDNIPTSLASLKAEWQAEALEGALGDMPDSSEMCKYMLRVAAKEKRRQTKRKTV